MQQEENCWEVNHLFKQYQHARFSNSDATEWLDVILFHILCQRLNNRSSHASPIQSVDHAIIDSLLLQFQHDVQSLCSNIPLSRHRPHHTASWADQFLLGTAVQNARAAVPTAETTALAPAPSDLSVSASADNGSAELSLLVEYLVGGRGLHVLTALCYLHQSVFCVTSEMCLLLCSLVEPLLQSLPPCSGDRAGGNNNNNIMGSCCCDWCFTSLPATWQHSVTHGYRHCSETKRKVGYSHRRHQIGAESTEDTEKKPEDGAGSGVRSSWHHRHDQLHRRRLVVDASSDDNDCVIQKENRADHRLTASLRGRVTPALPGRAMPLGPGAGAADSSQLSVLACSEWLAVGRQRLLIASSDAAAAGCCFLCLGSGSAPAGSCVGYTLRLLLLLLCRQQLRRPEEKLAAAVRHAVLSSLSSDSLALYSCRHQVELLLFTLTLCSVPSVISPSLQQPGVCAAGARRLMETLSAGVWRERHGIPACALLAVCRYCACLLAVCGRTPACHSRYAQHAAVVLECLRKFEVRWRVEACFVRWVGPGDAETDSEGVAPDYDCSLTDDCRSGLIVVLAELCSHAPTCSDVAFRSSRLTSVIESSRSSMLQFEDTSCRLSSSPTLTPCLTAYLNSILITIATELVKIVLNGPLKLRSTKRALVSGSSASSPASAVALLELCRVSTQRLRVCSSCWCPSTGLSSLFHSLSLLVTASVQQSCSLLDVATGNSGLYHRHTRRPGAVIESAGRSVVALISWLLSSAEGWRQCGGEHQQQWLAVCAHLLTSSAPSCSVTPSYVGCRLRRCLRSRLLDDLRCVPPETAVLLMSHVFSAPLQSGEQTESPAVTASANFPAGDTPRVHQVRGGSLALTACCVLTERLLVAGSCPAADPAPSGQLQLLQLLQPLQLAELLSVPGLRGRVQLLFCTITNVSLRYWQQSSDALADECVAVLLSVGINQLNTVISSHQVPSHFSQDQNDHTAGHQRDVLSKDEDTPVISHHKPCSPETHLDDVAFDLHCVANLWLTCHAMLAVSAPLCCTSLLLQPTLHHQLLSACCELLICLSARDAACVSGSAKNQQDQQRWSADVHLLCSIVASVVGVCLSLERHCADDVLGAGAGGGVSAETMLVRVLAELTPVSPPLQRHLTVALLTTCVVDIGNECSLHKLSLFCRYTNKDSLLTSNRKVDSHVNDGEEKTSLSDVDEGSDISNDVVAYNSFDDRISFNDVGGACVALGGACTAMGGAYGRVGGVDAEMGGANAVECEFDGVSGYEADGEGSAIGKKRCLKDVWRIGNLWMLHCVVDLVTRAFLRHCDSYLRQKCIDVWQHYLHSCGVLDSDNGSVGNSVEDAQFAAVKRRREGSAYSKEGSFLSVPAEDACEKHHERLYLSDENLCHPTESSSFGNFCPDSDPAVSVSATTLISSKQVPLSSTSKFASPLHSSSVAIASTHLSVSSLSDSIPIPTTSLPASVNSVMTSLHPPLSSLSAPSPTLITSSILAQSFTPSAPVCMTSSSVSMPPIVTPSHCVGTAAVTPSASSLLSSESWVVTGEISGNCSGCSEQLETIKCDHDSADRQTDSVTPAGNKPVVEANLRYVCPDVSSVTIKTTSPLLSEIPPMTAQSETAEMLTTGSTVYAAETREIRAEIVETPTAETAETPAAETPETPTAETAETPTAETAETPTAETAETPTAETAETPTAETAETPTAETAETPAAETAEISTAGTAETPAAEIAGISVAVAKSSADLEEKISAEIPEAAQAAVPNRMKSAEEATAKTKQNHVIISQSAEELRLTYYSQLERACQLLLTLCRQSVVNTALLQHSNITHELVSRLEPLFQVNEPCAEDAVRLCLQLFLYVHRNNFSVNILRFYSSFFTSPNPPVSVLVDCLSELVDDVVPSASCCFQFGCEPSAVMTADPAATGTAAASPAVSAGLARKWQEVHLGRRLDSCFAHSAASVFLNSVERPFDPFAGFSLSVWLRLSPGLESGPHTRSTGMAPNSSSGESSARAHLFSLVSDGRALELWLQAPAARAPAGSGASILLRRCELGSSTLTVLATVTVHSVILPVSGSWHHLAVRVVSNGSFSTVSVFVDGTATEVVDLPTAGGSLPPAAEVQLLLGDRQLDSCFCLQLSCVSVFGEPVLDLDMALLLKLLGPESGTLSSHSRRKFDTSMLATHTSHAEVTSAHLVRVVGSFGDMLAKLESALLLTLSADRPNWACLHTTPSEGVPVAVRVLWQAGALHTSRLNSVITAVSLLGGIHFLLYLLARVVELRAGEVTQARVLSVLLAALPAVECFDSYRGDSSSLLADALAVVFSSDYCRVSPWLLREYLLGCISGLSVLVRDPAVVVEISCSNPAIVNYQLIRGLFTHWPVWLSYNDGELFSLAISAVTACLDRRHQLSGYNRHIVQEYNLLQTVLDFLLSFFVDNSGAVLSWSVTEHVLSLLAELLNLSTDGSALAAVWRAILLLHPDSHMFVRVDRSSCFYLLEPCVRQRGDSLIKRHRLSSAATSETVTTAEMSEAELYQSSTVASPSGESVTTALSAVTPSKQQLVSRFLQSLPDARPRCPSVIQPPPELSEVHLTNSQQLCSAATSCDLPGDELTESSGAGFESRSLQSSGALPVRTRQSLADLLTVEAAEIADGWHTNKPSRVDCHQLVARLIDVVTGHVASVSQRERAPLLRCVKLEHLCSIVSHPVSAVRCSVIKLTSLYVRSSCMSSASQVSSSFFPLLASQLYRLPADLPLAATCCSLAAAQLVSTAVGVEPSAAPARDDMGVFAVLLALLSAPLVSVPMGEKAGVADCQSTSVMGVLRSETAEFVSLRVVDVLAKVIDKFGWVVPGLLDMGAVEALLSAFLLAARSRAALAGRSASIGDICDAHCAGIADVLVSIARHLLMATSAALFRALSDVFVLVNFMYTAEKKRSTASSVASSSSSSSISAASAMVHLHLTLINSCLLTLKNTLNLPWTRYLSCWPSQKQLRDRNRRLLLWSADILSLLEPRGLSPCLVENVLCLLEHVAGVSDSSVQSGLSPRGNRPGVASMLDSVCLSLLCPDWCVEVRLRMASILCRLSRSHLESLLVSSHLSSARRRQQLISFLGELLRSSDGRARSSSSSAVDSDALAVSAQERTESSAHSATSSALPAGGTSTLHTTAGSNNHGALSCGGRSEVLSRSSNAGRMESGDQYTGEELAANLRRLINLVWRQTLRSRQKCCQDDDIMNVSFYTRQFRGDRCALLVQWQNKVGKLEKRALHCFDSHYSRMCSRAVQYTAECTQAQNRARLEHIQMLRAGQLREAEARSLWRLVCSEMTEHAAPFEHPRNKHWFSRLGNCQGWLQQCRLLKRSQLMLDRRFFKPEAKHRLECEQIPAPLSYLLSTDSGSNLSADYIKQMHSSSIKYTVTCDIIVLDCSVSGEVLLSNTSIFFVVDKLTAVAEDLALADIESGYLQWPCADVYEVRRRRYELRDCAAELFLQTGRSHLLVFSATQVRDQFMSELLGNTSVHINDTQLLSDCTVRWREGTLSNFEYLMILNKMAGRSFNDLMQYPVFPFVLADYSSESIDLGSPAVYRDLRRPMGVQNQQRETFYRQRYAYLQSTEAMGVDTPYHYSSLYSNSAVVMHFLLRVPPFTNFFLRFQDGSFDLADRTFHSVPHTWRLSSSASGTDFKELIPEFYYLHEMFYNTQDFRLGYRQSGAPVDCVALPGWTRLSGCDSVRQMAGQSRLFVLVLRQALESDTVRRALPHWIDLVFGLKQRGAAAVQAVNVFHPATYGGYDVDLCGEMSVEALQTMVRTYGQIPRLLFRSAHPHMADNFRPPSVSKVSLLPCVTGLRWGDCVGSPDVSVVSVVWKRPLSASAVSLVLLPASSAVAVLPPSTGLAVHWDRGKDYRTAALPTADQLSWVNWGQVDGIVRLWSDNKLNTIATPSGGDQVEMCCYASGKVWLAMTSGAILIADWPVSGHLSCDASQSVSVRRCQLTHHCDRLVCLRAWHEYAVVTSADRCGVIAIWHADSVELLRRIRIGGSVIDLFLSRSMADLFVAYAPFSSDMLPHHPHPPATNNNINSCLAAVTINGAEVANCFCDRQVTCVTVSGVTEGLAVNLVAAGTISGHVTFYDTWRLQQIGGGLPAPSVPSEQRSVTSLCYSSSGRALLVLHQCWMLVLWSCSGLRPSNRALSVLYLNSLSPLARSLPDWSYQQSRQVWSQ